jgi:branched-chain amino acid transport system ATP-binding protein
MTSVEVQDTVSGSPATGNLVELRNVTAGYGGATVLRDISISVPPSTVVAVLGPNGAGKTTLLKVATGLVRSRQGQILLNGEDVTSQPAHMIARKGFCHIPEGRGIFPSLSVRDNIVLSSPKGKESEGIERTGSLFPVLGARMRQIAGSLSGGEQQQLAMARAMISNPTVVAVDEASLGLSPVMVDKIYETLRQIVASGVSLILVEQYVSRAIEFADSVYLINRGTVAYSGPAQGLDGDELFARYLGEDAT